MGKVDDETPYYGATTEQADHANKLFYERFGSFPAPPRDWRTFEDQDLGRDLVLQEVGDWDHRRLPDGGQIWVAGCGAVQAVEVALQFPRQRVLATDLSEVALAFGDSLAKQIGLPNLEIKCESIFDATYQRRFDLVISRGVIHHTANPPLALEKLARALKPDGLLDLTLINRRWEGWQMCISFRQALRLLSGSDPDHPDFESDYRIGKQLVREVDPQVHFIARLRSYFPQFNMPAELDEVPDYLLGGILNEPNMHTYTVASFSELCAGAGLALVSHGSIEPGMAAYSWDLGLESPELRARYDALPQEQRWQITNLLAPGQPRVLRFYAQHRESAFPAPTDHRLCEGFLARRFEKVAATAVLYTRSDDPSGVITGSRKVPFPSPPEDEELRRILAAHDPSRPMGETFRALGIEGFRRVNVLRRRLTTPPCPYLRAV